MSEDQKNKYEEAARKLFPDEIGEGRLLQRACFIEGCKHAHSDGKKEGWNEAVEAIKIIINKGDFMDYEDAFNFIKDEIQKLRK